jgi:hypothetical protein
MQQLSVGQQIALPQNNGFAVAVFIVKMLTSFFVLQAAFERGYQVLF